MTEDPIWKQIDAHLDQEEEDPSHQDLNDEGYEAYYCE